MDCDNMKLKLKAIRVIEVLTNENTGKIRGGKFLFKDKPNEIMSGCEMEQMVLNLAEKYNVPKSFVHCDFEVIEN